MLQYYTLEEAAKLLGMHADGAKKILDDRKVRQYRDGRGKVRYVASAVDELARTLGRGSDPELPLGEAARPKTGNTPRPSKVADEGSTSNFELSPADSADVPIGHEKLDASGSASKRSGRSPRPAGSKSPSPRLPAPMSGSDSDVRLVAEGSEMDFQIAADSDVKMVDEGSSSRSGPKSGIGSKSGSRKGPGESHDSEVRIVDMHVPSDSDVRIADEAESSVELAGRPPVKKHSDSDIRLEDASAHPSRANEGSDDAHVTEEIDLDAEARKHAEAQKGKGKSKMKRADKPQPAASPFELSDDELELPKGGKKKPDSSSDFELTPAADSDDSVELSSGEMRAMAEADSSDEEVNLGEVSSGAGTSGINLDAPADSGISLEGSGEGESADEMEFELSLDAPKTPRPAPKAGPKSGKHKKVQPPAEEDSSSEFELTLDADSSAEQPKLQKPAAKGPLEEDSDSEFELTLDDSGGLVPLEGDSGKRKAPAAKEAESSDVFETDFEVPALDEEESGSEAVALDESDTDLESSDFDLALEEGDAAGGEESGSQVVALEDEEEVDAAAETVQRPRRRAAAQAAAEEVEGEEALDELAGVDDEAVVSEEEAEEAPQRGRAAPAAAVAAAPAQWGAMPALVLLPCVIIMLLAGLMGYELINNMVGYQQPGKVSGFLSEALAKTFDMDLPKD